MKKITIPCDCADGKQDFPIYLGNPLPGTHPIAHQAAWISRERGCTVPKEVMDALQELYNIAMETGRSFVELVDEALAMATEDSESAQPAEADRT